MNRQQFFVKLNNGLSVLPRNERMEILKYYNEIFDDKLEEGLAEWKIIEQLGSVDVIVSNSLNEYRTTTTSHSDNSPYQDNADRYYEQDYGLGNRRAQVNAQRQESRANRHERRQDVEAEQNYRQSAHNQRYEYDNDFSDASIAAYAVARKRNNANNSRNDAYRNGNSYADSRNGYKQHNATNDYHDKYGYSNYYRSQSGNSHTENRSPRSTMVVVMICTCFIWLPVLIGLTAGLFGLVIGLAAAAFSIILSGYVCLFVGTLSIGIAVVTMFTSLGMGLCYLAAALVCLGIGFLIIAFSKYIFAAVGLMGKSIARLCGAKKQRRTRYE